MNTNGSHIADREQGRSVAERLGALSDPLRLRLLRLLEQEELSVGEVAAVVQLPQSTVSRHLKQLAETGWVQRRAEGTAGFYRLVMDDSPAEARELWRVVRKQIGDAGQVQEDLRRLDSVLRERQTDSQAFFGRIAGEWDAVRAELFGRGFTAEALLGLVPGEWQVADLGCGTGNISELLAPFVKRIVAVDQAGPMLRAAKKRLKPHGNVEFVKGRVTAIPIEEGEMDAAALGLVLHHLERPVEALTETRRILKAGGAALVIDMREHDRTEYRRRMGHRHLGFDERTMRGLLGEAGFERVRWTALPDKPEGKGPGLFVATGVKP